MDQIKIGKFIAELRTELGLTQKELGDKLGVSYKAISKWENGICLPDASLYNEICDIFKITKDEFFSGNKKEIDYKKKYQWILMILCLITILVIMVTPLFITNNLIKSIIISIFIVITLLYFNFNIYKLINIKKDNKKIKLIRIFNYLLIIIIPILIIFTMLKDKIIFGDKIDLIIVCLLISSGVFFYNIPFNRYIGLRLPWTIRDESTWKIAHKVLAIISIPISLLTILLNIIFKNDAILLMSIIIWFLIPSLISGVHFFKLYIKNK